MNNTVGEPKWSCWPHFASVSVDLNVNITVIWVSFTLQSSKFHYHRTSELELAAARQLHVVVSRHWLRNLPFLWVQSSSTIKSHLKPGLKSRLVKSSVGRCNTVSSSIQPFNACPARRGEPSVKSVSYSQKMLRCYARLILIVGTSHQSMDARGGITLTSGTHPRYVGITLFLEISVPSIYSEQVYAQELRVNIPEVRRADWVLLLFGNIIYLYWLELPREISYIERLLE